MLLAVSAAILAAPILAAEPPQPTAEQKAMMEAYAKAATPGAEHKDLASMAGTYDLKIKSWDGSGGPPMEETGTAKRSMILDGRVLTEEVKSTMMGAPFVGHGMMGYDNTTGKYWSTWNDTMMTGLMTTEGTCDAQKKCTFQGSQMDPVRKTVVKMRMTTHWPSPTVEVFEMYAPDDSGKEMKMMEITYTKK
jgi:hypothetical protein